MSVSLHAVLQAAACWICRRPGPQRQPPAHNPALDPSKTAKRLTAVHVSGVLKSSLHLAQAKTKSCPTKVA